MAAPNLLFTAEEARLVAVQLSQVDLKTGKKKRRTKKAEKARPMLDCSPTGFEGDAEFVALEDDRYEILHLSTLAQDAIGSLYKKIAPNYEAAEAWACNFKNCHLLQVKPPVRRLTSAEYQRWQDLVDARGEDLVVAAGVAYQICPEPSAAGAERGSSGREFAFTFADGRKVITRNRWVIGTVPAEFRDELPDNALMEEVR